MRKNTIIEHDRFKLITTYEQAVKGLAARNHLKMEMLNSIITVIGEKWNRMKQDTKSALEYICFLSIERGFAYSGSQHVSERYDIDSSTVRRYLCHLEKEGCIRRIWRSSTKHNGRGQAVIFFTIHPYYQKHWESMFFSDEETQVNTQAEIVQTSTESRENESLIVSTEDKPNIFKKNLNKRTNEFVKYAENFFHSGVEIQEFWKIIRLQTYWLDYSDQEKSTLGINALKQLIRQIKLSKRKVKNPFGMFYSICKGILDREYEELLHEGA
jgi:hypothetical protein